MMDRPKIRSEPTVKFEEIHLENKSKQIGEIA